jgi:ribosomal protein S12 methylthiotransferase
MHEIHEAIAQKTSGKCQRVVVAGCLVQRHKTQLLADAPGIDRLVGVFNREQIVMAVRGSANPRQAHGHFLGKYHDLSETLAAEANLPMNKTSRTSRLPVFEDDRARLRLTPRHFAYLRISEGCNQGCSFCTIPSIRGPMRSKPIGHVLAEAAELAADGAVELNLIGQDTTSYGTDIGYTEGLSGLLRSLNRQLKDVHWLRLMYAYPSCFTDEMIRTLADSDRFVKYIDMPLQHINDRILTQMRRRVTRKQIETLLQKLRDWIPGISVRTTFITGSPGETDTEHAELVQFVKDFGFDMMGVFPYSPEPGTPMGKLEGQIPQEIKQTRLDELMSAQQEIAFTKAKDRIGQSVDVLIDRPVENAKDSWIGRTTWQAPEIDSVVRVKGRGLHAGQLVSVKVTDSDGYDLLAKIPAVKNRALTVVR